MASHFVTVKERLREYAFKVLVVARPPSWGWAKTSRSVVDTVQDKAPGLWLQPGILLYSKSRHIQWKDCFSKLKKKNKNKKNAYLFVLWFPSVSFYRTQNSLWGITIISGLNVKCFPVFPSSYNTKNAFTCPGYIRWAGM